MNSHTNRLSIVLTNPVAFIFTVISAFRKNQGFLLSGAVAYYTLLSVVPMFALFLVVLSQVMDTSQLFDIAAHYLELIAPGQSDAIIRQISALVDNWKVVSVVGILILLFFSSLAFTSLENAMAVIFHHRVSLHRRHFMISAIMPYLYILLLALGLLTVSAISAALHTSNEQTVTLLGYTISISGAEAMVIYMLGLLGEILLLTSLYLVMPVGRLQFRHALVGGITATLLWELTRHFLIWYFSTLSLVNVIYGSFTSTIIILLSVEAGALILLLGAQVIASYEHIDVSSRDEL